MESWQRLLDALGPAEARLGLRPPATEAAIAGAETLFERALPADYRALLAICDGQDGPQSVLPSGGLLLPLARVVEAWLQCSKHMVPEWDAESVPPDVRVRPLVWHPTRIPIGEDGNGMPDPFLDLAPGPRGTVGQVIALVSECDFVVVGESLADYFLRTANLLIGGQIRIDDDGLVRTSNAWIDLVELR